LAALWAHAAVLRRSITSTIFNKNIYFDFAFWLVKLDVDWNALCAFTFGFFLLNKLFSALSAVCVCVATSSFYRLFFFQVFFCLIVAASSCTTTKNRKKEQREKESMSERA